MKTINWIAINKNGTMRIRKTKPDLNWDEIAIRMKLDVPDELFKRPQIDASLTITDVPNITYDPSIILNTKELIEQQTGAKINFTIVHEEKPENKFGE